MAVKSKTEKAVYDLIKEIVELQSIDLIDTEFKKEGKEWFLRIIIDKNGGVNLDDCADISALVEPLLDENDIITIPYNLEVSSPGVDRPIITQRDFERNIGVLVEVHPIKPIGQKKWFEGILESFSDVEIIITLDEPFMKGVKPKTNGQNKQFLRNEVKLVKKAVRF